VQRILELGLPFIIVLLPNEEGFMPEKEVLNTAPLHETVNVCKGPSRAYGGPFPSRMQGSFSPFKASVGPHLKQSRALLERFISFECMVQQFRQLAYHWNGFITRQAFFY